MVVSNQAGNLNHLAFMLLIYSFMGALNVFPMEGGDGNGLALFGHA